MSTVLTKFASKPQTPPVGGAGGMGMGGMGGMFNANRFSGLYGLGMGGGLAAGARAGMQNPNPLTSVKPGQQGLATAGGIQQAMQKAGFSKKEAHGDWLSGLMTTLSGHSKLAEVATGGNSAPAATSSGLGSGGAGATPGMGQKGLGTQPGALGSQNNSNSAGGGSASGNASGQLGGLAQGGGGIGAFGVVRPGWGALRPAGGVTGNVTGIQKGSLKTAMALPPTPGITANQPMPPGPPGMMPQAPPGMPSMPPPNGGAPIPSAGGAPSVDPATGQPMPPPGGDPAAQGGQMPPPGAMDPQTGQPVTSPMQDAPPPPLPMNPRMTPPRAPTSRDQHQQGVMSGLGHDMDMADSPLNAGEAQEDMQAEAMAMGSKTAFDAYITKLASGRFSAIRAARQSFAAKNPISGSVLGTAKMPAGMDPRKAKALTNHQVGRHEARVNANNEMGGPGVAGQYNTGTRTAVVADAAPNPRGTFRHERMHGMIDAATRDPSLAKALPFTGRLAARLSAAAPHKEKSLRRDAGMFLNELTAHAASGTTTAGKLKGALKFMLKAPQYAGQMDTRTGKTAMKVLPFAGAGTVGVGTLGTTAAIAGGTKSAEADPASDPLGFRDRFMEELARGCAALNSGFGKQARSLTADEGGEDAPAGPGSPMRGWQWKVLQKDQAEAEKSWMPRLFKNDATPLTELLASPGKQSLLGGLAGGALGGAAGTALGHYTDTGMPSWQTGLIGGGLGALLGGVKAYSNRRYQNDLVTDALRRTPPGATVKDYKGVQEADAMEEKRKKATKVASEKESRWLAPYLIGAAEMTGVGAGMAGMPQDDMYKKQQQVVKAPMASPSAAPPPRKMPVPRIAPRGKIPMIAAGAAGLGALAMGKSAALGEGNDPSVLGQPVGGTPVARKPLPAPKAIKPMGNPSPMGMVASTPEKTATCEELTPFAKGFFQKCDESGIPYHEAVEKVGSDYGDEARDELLDGLEKIARSGWASRQAGNAVDFGRGLLGFGSKYGTKTPGTAGAFGAKAPAMTPSVAHNWGAMGNSAAKYTAGHAPKQLLPTLGGAIGGGFAGNDMGLGGDQWEGPMGIKLNVNGMALGAGASNPYLRRRAMRNMGGAASVPMAAVRTSAVGSLGGSAIDGVLGAANLNQKPIIDPATGQQAVDEMGKPMFETRNTFGRLGAQMGLGLGGLSQGGRLARMSKTAPSWVQSAGRGMGTAEKRVKDFAWGQFQPMIGAATYLPKKAINYVAGRQVMNPNFYGSTWDKATGTWVRNHASAGTRAGRLAGAATLGLGGVGGAYGIAQDKIRGTVRDSLAEGMAEGLPMAGEFADQWMDQRGMLDEQGQFDPSQAMNRKGGMLGRFAGGADQIFQSMGMNPASMSPLQKLMILGGATAGGGGLLAGSPVLAGMGGASAMAGLLPQFMPGQGQQRLQQGMGMGGPQSPYTPGQTQQGGQQPVVQHRNEWLHQQQPQGGGE